MWTAPGKGIFEPLQGSFQPCAGTGDIQTGKAFTLDAKGLALRHRPTGLLAQEGGQHFGRKPKGAKIDPEKKSALGFDQIGAVCAAKEAPHKIEIT